MPSGGSRTKFGGTSGAGEQISRRIRAARSRSSAALSSPSQVMPRMAPSGPAWMRAPRGREAVCSQTRCSALTALATLEQRQALGMASVAGWSRIQAAAMMQSSPLPPSAR